MAIFREGAGDCIRRLGLSPPRRNPNASTGPAIAIRGFPPDRIR